MSDLRPRSIRDLIAELADIEDRLRVTATHAHDNARSANGDDMTTLVAAERNIIEELRRPHQAQSQASLDVTRVRRSPVINEQDDDGEDLFISRQDTGPAPDPQVGA